MTMKSVVIIPTFNESENIPELKRRLPKDIEVLIVDDSPDNETAEAARKAGFQVLKRTNRKGLSSAVIDGIKHTNADKIAVMDADLQHPPELIPQILRELDTHDLVVASKHMNGAYANMTRWRKLQSNLGCIAAKLLTPISDPMTGFFGIRRECLEGVELDDTGFKIGLEIFCKTNWTSHSEIPLEFEERQRGVSKGTMNSLHKHLWELYKSSINYRVAYPKGSEEWRAFYEGDKLRKKWKQDIASTLQRITQEIKPESVLDVGCGSSPNLNHMSANKRVGMDINVDALEFMKKHSPEGTELVYGSVLDIPFPDDSFDCVTCIEVLEHLYPNEIDRALSEITRVARRNVVIATPNYASPIWNVTEYTQKLLQPGHWTSDHHTHFNRKTLNELCRRYGLGEVRCDSVMRNADMIITYKKEMGKGDG